MSDLLLSFIMGIIASSVATIPGTILYIKWKKFNENTPLKKILNFAPDEDLIFVFSHREEIKGGILPRTSTEDFMAINNMKTALIKINWTKFDKVRDTRRLEQREEQKRKNLITICSAKSNAFTKEVEDLLLARGKHIYRVEQDPFSLEWLVTDGQFPYRSKAYSQAKTYLEDGLSTEDVAAREFQDIAYITKVTNPFEGRAKILIIAGVRGIGTWGAAECIKKEWQQIYDKLPKRRKDCDFSALVIINYKNMDITKITVHHVIVIE